MATEAKRLWNRWPLQRPPGVDEVGIAPMSFPDRPAQTIGRFRRHQVDMVGHEAIGPDLHAGLARLLGQQIAIDLMIAVLEEDRLPPVAALGLVMREAGNDQAGEARHGKGHSKIIAYCLYHQGLISTICHVDDRGRAARGARGW